MFDSNNNKQRQTLETIQEVSERTSLNYTAFDN